jgi:Root hair defective 3 GTP-binding protein (RHD3)
MCRGRDMNVLVMDVEGTDGRERGEDQVHLDTLINSNHLNSNSRISNANRRYSPLRRQKFSLSTSGNTKLVCIRAPIWGS